jgi:hypothetical protein
MAMIFSYLPMRCIYLIVCKHWKEAHSLKNGILDVIMTSRKLLVIPKKADDSEMHDFIVRANNQITQLGRYARICCRNNIEVSNCVKTTMLQLWWLRLLLLLAVQKYDDTLAYISLALSLLQVIYLHEQDRKENISILAGNSKGAPALLGSMMAMYEALNEFEATGETFRCTTLDAQVTHENKDISDEGQCIRVELDVSYSRGCVRLILCVGDVTWALKLGSCDESIGVTDELLNFVEYLETVMRVRRTTQSVELAVKHTLNETSRSMIFFVSNTPPMIRKALSYLINMDPYQVMTIILTVNTSHLFDENPLDYDEIGIRSMAMINVLRVVGPLQNDRVRMDFVTTLLEMVKLAVKQEGTGQDADVQNRMAKAKEIMQLVLEQCVHRKESSVIQAFLISFLKQI